MSFIEKSIGGSGSNKLVWAYVLEELHRKETSLIIIMPHLQSASQEDKLEAKLCHKTNYG